VRNLEQFIFLVPGVTGNTNDTQISGSPNRAKEVLVDGIASTGVESGGIVPGSGRPSVETIGEFKLLRANFNAEYGRTGGGVQIFTTKSGTNSIHGAVFDYLRNDKLDARGFYQRTRPINRQNEFGAVIGGPVRIPGVYDGRNKTFFHFVYSGFRYRQGAPNSVLSLIPLDFRQGDFSRLTAQLYDPATNRSTATGIARDPFPANRIPQNRFSAVSSKILPQLATPINNGIFNNFISVGRARTTSNQVNVKLDHAFTDRSRVSGYVYRDINEQFDPELVPGPASPNRKTGSRNFWTRVSHDYVVSPSKLNHINLGYTRFVTLIESYSLNGDWPNKLGLKGVNAGPDNGFPAVDFASAGFQSLGDLNRNSRTLQANNLFQLGDSFSWIRGNHSMKFGIDYRWSETNGIDPWQSMGWFTFNALETGQPGVNNTGNAVASFLLGAANRGQMREYAYFPRNRYQYYAFYAQDDWKVNRKLTLNYGLRWDIFVPRYEKQGNLSTFDLGLPNPGAGNLPGALTFFGEGQGRNGNKRLADIDWKAFGPRLGIAYQVTQQTVLRGGYGIYYALGNANAGLRDSLNSSWGFIQQPTFVSQDAGVTPAFYWDNGFPQNFCHAPCLVPTGVNGTDVRMVQRSDGRAPYFQNWSFTIERELASLINLEVTYLGTKGTRIGNALMHLNELDPAYLRLGSLLTRPVTSAEAAAAGIRAPYAGFTGSVAQALKPFPHMNDVFNRSNPSGSSTYNALQSQLQVRSFKGLDVQVAYTFAKTLSDADVLAGGGTAGQTFYNRRLEKTLAITDVPHVFAMSWSYDLPFARNWKGVAGRLLGGWVLTGIHQYSVGVPIILTANNTLPLGNQVLRPDAVAGASRRTSVSGFDPARDLWINRDAFRTPAAFTFGSSARSYGDLRAPNFLNENFGLIKRVKFLEHFTATFRGELFNAFNRTVFSAPQANVSNAQFGRITAQSNTPRQGQVALRLEF
jgi:outer membrane receptor protein involved in Fe transport